MLISVEMDGKRTAFDPSEIRSVGVQIKDTASSKGKTVTCLLKGGEEYIFGLSLNLSVLEGLEGSQQEAAQKVIDWSIKHMNSEIGRLFSFLFDASNGKIADPCFVHKAVKF